jgi:hypothetical protein
MTTQIQYLADAFSARVQAALGARIVALVNLRNATDRRSDVCHTHDFCDANQLMLDAGEQVGIDTLNDINAANCAWDIAKEQGFTVQS